MILTEDWVFCHIPRTGGTNFSVRCLKAYARTDQGYTGFFNDLHFKHQPISYWKRQIPHTQDLPWITLIRNPYARYVSLFYLGHKEGYFDKSYIFEEFVKDRKDETSQIKLKTSGKFISADKWLYLRSVGVEYDPTWQMTKYIEDDEVKTFRLEDQLEEMEEYVGFKFTDTRFNETKHDPWETYYTEELREIVYERYQEDFERFSYER